MSKKHWATGALAVSAMVVTGVARAGLPQQTANDPASGPARSSVRQTRDWNQQGRATAGRANLDHYIVKVVTQANRDEIAQGQLANQRSSNPDVKKFGMQMVDEHTRLMNKLQQFRGERRGNMAPGTRQPSVTPDRGSSSIQPLRSIMLAQATSSSGDTANDHNATPGTVGNGAAGNGAAGAATTQSQDTANDHNAAGQPGQANPAPAAGTYNQQPGVTSRGFGSPRMAGQGADMGQQSSARQFAQIMDEVSQQNERSIERELSQKEGVQFDRCYLSLQVINHMWLIDALTVFERSASPSLQPILQEGLQAAQQHLTHAKALLSHMESQSKSTAQRDSATLQSR
jgi:predicted outer membrane protein